MPRRPLIPAVSDMTREDRECCVLTYHCPETKQLVRTNIETSKEKLQRLGKFKLSVWCPHCQTGHQTTASDASVSLDHSPLS
jgi:hypothetical protein